MRKISLIYAIILLVALTAVVAVAQGQKGNPPIPRWVNPPTQAGCFANCQKALSLTQDQIADITKIRAKFMEETAAQRADLQARMKEIAGLWAVDEPDLQMIKQKSAEADQARAQIRDKAIDARGAMLKALTPEQRATCIKLCQSGQCNCGMCGDFGRGMGMCGMGGQCPMATQNAPGTCPMGKGMGKGCGMGNGQAQCSRCPMK